MKFKKVFVVTGFDLGWDNILAVFDPEKVTKEELLKRFNQEDYHIKTMLVEDSLEEWED